MLLFFRNIQFTTIISLALYVGLLHLAAITGYLTPPEPMTGAGFPYEGLFGWAKTQPFWSAVAAAVLVFVQALFVNSLVDSFRLMNDRNWLPGMSYALVVSALPDFQFLSPPLVATTFIAFSLRSVFLTYKSPKSAALVFDAAFWISVSSLFYPNAILLIVALFIGIGVMRSWNMRDQIAFFVGIFVPLFLGWLWYFWGDMGSAFRTRHLSGFIGWPAFDVVFDLNMILKCSILVFLMLFYLINYSTFARSKSMQGQKCVDVLYWVLFVAAGATFFRTEGRLEAFALMSVPAGIFLAMGYQNMRNLFAEGMHLALLGFVLLLQYFPL